MENNGEHWAPIEGFSNYAVSTHGRVMNTKTMRMLALFDNGTGYLSAQLYKYGKGTNKMVHRLVAEAFVENPEGKPFVDHKTGDKLNNTVYNLRWATRSQNMRNMKSHAGSSSQYIGVSWNKGHGKWRACIAMDGKNRHLGYFDTERDAALVYDAAARIRDPEFARCNFPEDAESDEQDSEESFCPHCAEDPVEDSAEDSAETDLATDREIDRETDDYDSEDDAHLGPYCDT